MRIFLAGSTGVVGRSLVPLLIQGGHEVVALIRSSHKAGSLEAMGARVAVADALDAAALTEAVRKAEPEVILHQLTGLSGAGNLKKFDEELARTNRLRTEATDTLLAAAALADTRRFIAQSFCGWPFAREGGPVKSEEDPLDEHPPAMLRSTLAAIRHLEAAVRGAAGIEGLVLRYGMFYGPGTGIAKEGPIVGLVRQHKLPIVGGGAGVWSFIHIDDVARATAAAVGRGKPGIYNIVDDEPAPVSSWLPALAEAVGAPAPRKVPAWLARLAVGEGGVSMMTEARGGSNEKAKRELGWRPTWPSWRRGFMEGLA
jgi:nucleoside-diphosphate-sugar epimerase